MASQQVLVSSYSMLKKLCPAQSVSHHCHLYNISCLACSAPVLFARSQAQLQSLNVIMVALSSANC